jgi:hypothetical protein
MNEIYIEKLMSLINQRIISKEQIKDATYKVEVERRLILQQIEG